MAIVLQTRMGVLITGYDNLAASWLSVYDKNGNLLGGESAGCFVAKFSISGRSKTSLDYAIGNTPYIYIYGSELVDFTISGVLLHKAQCSTPSSAHGVAYMLPFIINNSAHSAGFPKISATFDAGTFSGYLLGFEINSGEGDLANFTLISKGCLRL